MPWRGGPWRRSRREFAPGIGAPVQGMIAGSAGRDTATGDHQRTLIFSILPASIEVPSATAPARCAAAGNERLRNALYLWSRNRVAWDGESKKGMPECAPAATRAAEHCAAWPIAGSRYSSPSRATISSTTSNEELHDAAPHRPAQETRLTEGAQGWLKKIREKGRRNGVVCFLLCGMV